MKRGRVIGHAAWFILAEVKGIVSQAGRERVLKNKRKNVHAFLEGVLMDYGVDSPEREIMSDKEIIYNPYKYDQFMIRQNDVMYELGEPDECAGVTIDDKPKLFCF
jgi:hypothetical protein